MKVSKVISSGIWYTLSNFLVKGIGFLTTPIFTRYLTKAEFGDFSNFATWTSIFAIIVSLNLESSLIRARFEFEDDLDVYNLSMILLSTLSTTVWYIIVSIFSDYFQSMLSMGKNYIDAMFIYLLFYPVINIFQTSERFKYKYKWTVAISVILALSTSGISVILVLIMNNSLHGRIIGYVVPYAIIGSVVYIYYLTRARKITIKYWKYALDIALPFIPHLLSMLILGSMDRVMIKQICGAEETALYSLAYTCGTIISLLVSSINNAFSPWLGEQLSKSNYKKIRQVSSPYAVIFSFIACGIVLLTPEILFILGGNSYMEAKWVIPPVAAGCIMQFLYCMYVNVEQYEKKTRAMALASVAAALINLVLNYIFINKYGYIAAAYTTYIGYLFLLLMHMYLVKRIGMKNLYNNKIIVGVVIVVSAFMIAVNFLFYNNVLRYLFGSIYFIAIIFIVIRYKNFTQTSHTNKVC